MSEERKIKNIAEYLKEVSKIKEGWSTPVLAFRGQENVGWPLASSAERRLKASSRDQGRVPKWLFIDYHRALLNKCKLKNYHQREGKPLDELELLANLQHHGAATCLIDFTRNALVALWFACEKSDADGKVFVVNTADEKAFLEITPTDIENSSISNILQFETRRTDKNQAAEPLTQETVATSLNKPNFWYWSPAHLNERITSQHSLFLFGSPSAAELKTERIVIESASKEQIRQELKELHDIHEESLFPDFVGFAYTQRHDALYTTPGAEEYFRRGIEAEQRGQYSEAVEYYTKVIGLRADVPAEIYLLRSLAYGHLGKHDQAIQDSTKAIGLRPDFADAYFIRAGAYGAQGKHDRAIPDLTTAIELRPDFADAYYNRGIAYGTQGDVDSAIEDYTTAIELRPDFADAYYNRGEVWLYLGEWRKAKADFVVAENMGVDLIALFHVVYKNIEELEQKMGAKLPEDIAAMLTENGNES